MVFSENLKKINYLKKFEEADGRFRIPDQRKKPPVSKTSHNLQQTSEMPKMQKQTEIFIFIFQFQPSDYRENFRRNKYDFLEPKIMRLEV